MLSRKAKKAFHAFWKIASKERSIWPQKRRLMRREEREKVLAEAGYNLFRIPSHAVSTDLLTDSGTSRMSRAQWMAMLEGDESYAGSKSWRRLKKKIQDVFGFPYVLPVHQGRAGERIFFETIINRRRKYVIGNTPFDTTRYWIEKSGGAVIDCLNENAYGDWRREPFFGDVDLEKFEKALRVNAKRIACAFITITCNSAGGQPVDIGNIHDAHKIAFRYGVRLFLDAARYAENAYFNKPYASSRLSIKDVIRETMTNADGILVSAKKDCLANIGGFIALNDEALYRALKPGVTAQEGYADGYGGMAGYTMESIAQGIEESLGETYLQNRIWLIQRLRDYLVEALGVPALPAGGHGVFVNAGEFLPQIPWHQFPGHALALELYLEGGVRAVEVGSLMLGRDPKTGKNRQARRELTRLAFPRRVYSWKDCEHLTRTFRAVAKRKERIHGVAFAQESEGMRHFDSVFRRVPASKGLKK